MSAAARGWPARSTWPCLLDPSGPHPRPHPPLDQPPQRRPCTSGDWPVDLLAPATAPSRPRPCPAADLCTTVVSVRSACRGVELSYPCTRLSTGLIWCL